MKDSFVRKRFRNTLGRKDQKETFQYFSKVRAAAESRLTMY